MTLEGGARLSRVRSNAGLRWPLHKDESTLELSWREWSGVACAPFVKRDAVRVILLASLDQSKPAQEEEIGSRGHAKGANILNRQRAPRQCAQDACYWPKTEGALHMWASRMRFSYAGDLEAAILGSRISGIT